MRRFIHLSVQYYAKHGIIIRFAKDVNSTQYNLENKYFSKLILLSYDKAIQLERKLLKKEKYLIRLFFEKKGV